MTSSRIVALVNFAICFAIIGVVITVLMKNPIEEPPGPNGCAVDKAPSAHAIMLIDGSDSLSELRGDIEDLVLAEYNSLPVGGMLTLRSINDAAQLVLVCRIKSARDIKSVWEKAGINPKFLDYDFQRLVEPGLADAREKIKSMPEAKTSPIVETIDEVIDLFASPDNRRLIIVSDMAQNTKQWSQYGAKWNMPNQSTRPMAGIAVRVHYVQRTTLPEIALQTDQHRSYWRDYFANSGVRDYAIGWGLEHDDPDPDKLKPLPGNPGVYVPAADWSVQIGAYSTYESAERALADIVANNGMQGRPRSVLRADRNGKTVHQARLCALAESDARSLCQSLSKKLDCFPAQGCQTNAAILAFNNAPGQEIAPSVDTPMIGVVQLSTAPSPSIPAAAADTSRGGPSFDCNQELKPVERLICGSPEFNALDLEMDKAFQGRIARLGKADAEAFRQKQRDWLESRDACSSDQNGEVLNCIRDHYERRLKELETASEAGGVPIYTIIRTRVQ